MLLVADVGRHAAGPSVITVGSHRDTQLTVSDTSATTSMPAAVSAAAADIFHDSSASLGYLTFHCLGSTVYCRTLYSYN